VSKAIGRDRTTIEKARAALLVRYSQLAAHHLNFAPQIVALERRKSMRAHDRELHFQPKNLLHSIGSFRIDLVNSAMVT
jgi:hypothetical protein